MIRGYCRTNLDNYERENWPTEFVAVPRKGEGVRAESGNSLRVCGVTHLMQRKTMSVDGEYECPIIEVELNK